ncbi:MAG: hypothetical protein OXC07_08795 [Kistimonas sp.]|nr:hypothetical protein [Kistimonas sp.]
MFDKDMDRYIVGQPIRVPTGRRERLYADPLLTDLTLDQNSTKLTRADGKWCTRLNADRGEND